MLVPLKWLRDYVDIDLDTKEFADMMTMSGTKVELVEFLGEDVQNVVVGKILDIQPHDNADKLIVTQIDVGTKKIQIVTGANNVSVGDYVPIALDGSKLPGGKEIHTGELRGVKSEGMMCSSEELGIDSMFVKEKSKNGIFLLDYEDSYNLGQDIRETLGLNDAIIDFELTSNRPDCRCIIGIAREAAVTIDKKVKYPEISVNGSDEEIDFSVEIENTSLCRRYIGRIIKDVKIEESPYWMQRRLIESGVRPINNIVDITNFVMLEMGQPMHAFDLKEIGTDKIVVKNAVDGEKFTTLDENERELDSDMLVITNGERSLAIAGVMGGLNSEITESTTEILFESANFEPENVRATSKKLGLRTESSSRYEKGIDPELAEKAVDRAVQLVELLGAGRVLNGRVEKYPTKIETKPIKASVNRINRLIGIDIEACEMVKILESLEFTCKLDGDSLEVVAPSFRLDIEQEVDLVEEIARLHGFDNIESKELEGNPTVGIKTAVQKFRDNVKNNMTAMGFDEILTYSFVSPSGLSKIKDNSGKESSQVEILNPLGEETSVMRTTLIPNMLDVVSTNVAHRVDELSIFEYGNVFETCEEDKSNSNIDKEPKQSEKLCIGMYGKNKDFFELKGVVETLLEKLGLKGCEIEPEIDNTTFHPGRCAKIVYKNVDIATFGELHPDVIENYDLGQRVYVCEIDADEVFANADTTSLYTPLPKYPSTSRDIALVVEDKCYVKQISDIIKENGGDLVESFELFDVYTGDQIEAGHKSVAYSIVYRSKDKTLTDEDVAQVHDKILQELKDKLGAELRTN
ncbi:MAG: phenylalanine--tRNA ligase subunit beta [Clostridioides sp.]|jgi:phenylalanyl-tRNA synthetase beta chain|nr:phenylalanine--tRNA ligase subunit beta [Clostridioides sp.]